MKARIGYGSYLATTLDYRESRQIPPERLAALVAALRAGDRSVIGEIIGGHLRLVAGIVGEMVRARRKTDDAMGAALLALVEAVHDAEAALYDGNITAYITSSVRFKVKTHLSDDHVVRMPGRTIRHRLAQGEAFEDVVPGDGRAIAEGEDRGNCGGGSDRDHRSYALPFVIPVAPPVDVRDTAEFRELVVRAAQGALNQAILDLRLRGFGYEEIGQRVGLSTARVGQVVPPLIERLSVMVR